MLKLTVPQEEWIEEAYECKKAKHLEVIEDCRRPAASPLGGLRGVCSLYFRHSLLGIRGM